MWKIRWESINSHVVHGRQVLSIGIKTRPFDRIVNRKLTLTEWGIGEWKWKWVPHSVSVSYQFTIWSMPHSVSVSYQFTIWSMLYHNSFFFLRTILSSLKQQVYGLIYSNDFSFKVSAERFTNERAVQLSTSWLLLHSPTKPHSHPHHGTTI